MKVFKITNWMKYFLVLFIPEEYFEFHSNLAKRWGVIYLQRKSHFVTFIFWNVFPFSSSNAGVKGANQIALHRLNSFNLNKSYVHICQVMHLWGRLSLVPHRSLDKCKSFLKLNPVDGQFNLVGDILKGGADGKM